MKQPDLDTSKICAWHPTGSAYTCSPPVENTDVDWVILPKDYNEFMSYLDSEGWVHGGSVINAMSTDAIVSDGMFNAFRKAEFNLMVVGKPAYYHRVVLATHMAKEFNLTEKYHRVWLFEVVADRAEGDPFDPVVSFPL